MMSSVHSVIPMEVAQFSCLAQSEQEMICGGGAYGGNVGFTQHLFRKVDGVPAPVWHLDNGYPPSYWGQQVSGYAQILNP